VGPVAVVNASSNQAGPLAIELPARYQVLHRHGVVPRTEAMLQVQAVRTLDLDFVELDAKPRLLGKRDVAALDA
jgi:hypothetical protein